MVDFSEDYADVLTAVQEGEFEIVQEIINARIVPVNTLDQSGCSLLHWAAINNRVIIARLLIENGLSKALPGGVLGETPLQWALRKKYYNMMEVIFKNTQCDLSSKSVQGNDALFLACKLCDVNGAFLVLSWGANPDTIDASGDTPLLWLLKNKPLGAGGPAQEIIKMLLRFGASPVAANEQDGNSPLHALCTVARPDLRVTFIIYQAAGAGGKYTKNKAGLTPHAMAVSTDNRAYARFLYDAMMFEALPYWSPAVAAAALISLAFLFVEFFGLIYGIVYWLLLYTATAWTLLQWLVVEHRDRSILGLYAGFALCQLVVYHGYVAHHVSYTMNLVVLVVVVVWGLSAVKFVRRKPAAVPKSENKALLAQRIVQSAPSEGTDEECLMAEAEGGNVEEGGDEAAAGVVDVNAGGGEDGGKGGVRFVRDHFTGQLRRVASTEMADSATTATTAAALSDGSHHRPAVPGAGFSKGRTLGPKVCGCCLADRRLYVKAHLSEVTLPSSALVSYLLPPVNSSGSGSGGRDQRSSSISTAVGAGTGEVIAIATHCEVCNACVIDQDHHSIFLCNCVGKGNRRMYWLFLFCGAAFCLLFFLGAKYVQHWHTCGDSAAVQASWILTRPLVVEFCVLLSQPAFALITWMSAACGTFCAGMLQIQVTSVARETTFRNVIKQRYEFRPPPYRRRVRNILTFLYSGLYNITYPKTGSRGRSDSTSSVATNGGGSPVPPPAAAADKDSRAASALTPSHTSPEQERQQYQQALRMLKNIDQKLSAGSGVLAAAEGGAGGLEAGRVAVPPAPVVGKSATTTYIAPDEHDLTPPNFPIPSTAAASAGSKKDCDDKNCQHCEDVEVFSDYDDEFIESELNNYNTYYFQDSENEDAAPLLPSGSGGSGSGSGRSGHSHNHSHHHHSTGGSSGGRAAAGSGGGGVGGGNSGSAKKRAGGAFQIGAEERL